MKLTGEEVNNEKYCIWRQWIRVCMAVPVGSDVGRSSIQNLKVNAIFFNLNKVSLKKLLICNTSLYS